MTNVEMAAFAFATLNGLRLLGYVPQWVAIRRDSGRAESISISAWTLWAASHASTAVYAHSTGDRLVTIVMTINALACASVVALTLVKRHSMPLRSRMQPASLAAIPEGERG
ncbi:hypothetical protein [Consotaella salsifontis]|uniref:PQ loop repeat-containing protein n=1 Tax=Consotaella salsifontis TaxID=1365950 RepID=A0A1T4TF33_9HYPH|nr:hypothetical protein [Consotaella salsifontis]SKA39105.1 hypothetical protein SAMN05428963_12811 [Consotaella salsifontis]